MLLPRKKDISQAQKWALCSLLRKHKQCVCVCGGVASCEKWLQGRKSGFWWRHSVLWLSFSSWQMEAVLFPCSYKHPDSDPLAALRRHPVLHRTASWHRHWVQSYSAQREQIVWQRLQCWAMSSDFFRSPPRRHTTLFLALLQLMPTSTVYAYRTFASLGTSLQIKKCSAGMLTAEFPHYASPSFSGAAPHFNIAECPWWGTEVAALAEDRLLTSLLTLFFLVFCKGRHSSSVASDCAGKHQGSETTAALWGVIKHLKPSHPREKLMHTSRASLHQLIPPLPVISCSPPLCPCTELGQGARLAPNSSLLQ